MDDQPLYDFGPEVGVRPNYGTKEQPVWVEFGPLPEEERHVPYNPALDEDPRV